MAKSTKNHDGRRMTLELDGHWSRRVDRLREALRPMGVELNLSLICREAVKEAVVRLEKEYKVR